MYVIELMHGNRNTLLAGFIYILRTTLSDRSGMNNTSYYLHHKAYGGVGGAGKVDSRVGELTADSRPKAASLPSPNLTHNNNEEHQARLSYFSF
jgi:hypothetical protein